MKLRDITIGTRLFLGIGVILLLVVAMAGTAYQQSNLLWKNTSEMYNYSLQVSKATRDIKADIITIQWLMKDIVLDENIKQNEIPVISNQIDTYENKVFKSFDIVYSKYLGNKSDIDIAYNSFRDWKPLREIVIDLMQKGDKKTKYTRFKTVNVPYIAKLLDHIQVIIDSSGKRADNFYIQAQTDKNLLFTKLWIVSLAIVVLSLIVGILLIRGIRNPLIELTGVADQLRKKQYSVRSNYRSANEIGVLASILNNMAAKVETELSVKENASWITGLILKENDLRAFSKVLLDLLLTKTASQVAAIYFLNEDGTQFEHYESIGLAKENCRSFFNHTKEGEFGAVLAEKKIVRITQIPTDTLFSLPVVTGLFRPREIITIPILDGKNVVSVISLASLNDFTPESVQLINEIWLLLTARINGVLAFRKVTGISDKLYHLNKDLEEKTSELVMQASELKEYNIELELQKRQLDEANQLKSSFLSNMSHELRTPLNSVIALSGVLNRRLSGTIPVDEYKYLGIIEKNGKHLLSLINDILDLSRIEAGKEELSFSAFSVYDLVHDLIGSLEPISQEKGIALINNVDPDIPSIICDSSKCHHILQNIIGNAIKFTNEGSVEITATIKKDQVHISVQDSGIGISPENLPYIFDEFRQVDGRASRIYGGTGLGLAIANKYCIMLNGNVKAESQLGSGSTFTVSLPVIPPLYKVNETEQVISKNALQKTAIDQRHYKGKNILLVEDNEVTIIQMKEILKEEEYNIHIAKNGKEALEILKIFTPDAIILDLMMPEVDGFEVLGSIRKVKETSEIPVLILSAKHVTKEELSFLKGNHIYQLIQKGDVNRNQLMVHIRNMVIQKDPESAQQIKLDPNLSGSSRKALILVIEDNPDNMETVKALLGKDNNIIEAYTGFEGLEKAKAFRPDLVLTDISLPGMDGLEVLREIKKDNDLKHIPVIALTARAMKGDREELIGFGFNDYISKPIDSNLLELTIKEWLNGN